jgi:hypothetical protein
MNGIKSKYDAGLIKKKKERKKERKKEKKRKREVFNSAGRHNLI